MKHVHVGGNRGLLLLLCVCVRVCVYLWAEDVARYRLWELSRVRQRQQLLAIVTHHLPVVGAHGGRYRQAGGGSQPLLVVFVPDCNVHLIVCVLTRMEQGRAQHLYTHTHTHTHAHHIFTMDHTYAPYIQSAPKLSITDSVWRVGHW